MRKTWFALMAGLMAAGLSSCSEDFDVAAPYKEVTVVYGLLNMGDTAHYVRVQKAFLDDSKSALDMAKVADSSFYGGLQVQMKEIDTVTKNVRATFTMERVHLEDEGYPKQPGPFFDAPNLAYKLKHTLSPSYLYRLVVRHADGRVDSAETNIISNNPNTFTVNEMDRIASYAINFSSPSSPNGIFQLFLGNPLPRYAQLFEGTIRFYYVNKNSITGDQTDMPPLDYTFDTKSPGGPGLHSLTIPHVSIFNFLKAGIQPPPNNTTDRYLDSCDLIVWAGSHALYEYRRFSMLQGGLTGDQIKPIYTNIKGENVLGLFASRAQRIKTDIPINKATMDTLMKNPITLPLAIKGVSDH